MLDLESRSRFGSGEAVTIPKPSFLIVGAAKCGTSALASILDVHPECCMGRPKEVCYFQDNIDFMPNTNFHLGWEWYQRAFAHYKDERVVGEATPSYSDRSRSPRTAHRIFEFNPEMKIIYMVRDPFERQLSEWKMQYFEGTNGIRPERVETQWAIEGFDSWMEKQLDAGQWSVCRYSYQIQAYRDFFAPDHIFITFLEDWKGSKASELARVFDFLDLNCNLWDDTFKENANREGDRSVERQWIKLVRRNRYAKAIATGIPCRLKKLVPKTLIRNAISLPSVDLRSSIVEHFINYISSDCYEFLDHIGREASVWPCLSQSAANAGEKK